MRIKGLVVLFIISATTICSLFLVHGLARPKISIKFSEPFDPVLTVVTLGDTKLYPSGEGGRIYKGRGSVLKEKEKITIRGAFVEEQEIEIYTQLFGEVEEIVSVKQIEAETVVKRFLESDSFSGTRQFGNNWIVSIPEKAFNGEKTAIAIHYETESGRWVDETGSIKSADNNLNIPSSAIEYFYRLSDD